MRWSSIAYAILSCMLPLACSFVMNHHAQNKLRAEGRACLFATRIVIVGGGVGGLAIASRLATAFNDANITILEKNSHVGGRMGSFYVDVPDIGRFRHERGPSLLLLPEVYHDLFKDCGSDPESFGLRMQRCLPAYQVIFDDGDRIDLGFDNSNSDQRLSELEMESRKRMDAFEYHGASKWDKYMSICEAYLECGLPNFIEERIDLPSFPAFLRASLEGMGKAWPLKPHSSVLDAVFESSKMKALASFQDLYVGLEPFENKNKLAGGILSSTAPAVFGLLAAIEMHPSNRRCGVFAPVGGFDAVSKSMEKLAMSEGVSIECNAMVTQVTSDSVTFQSTGSGEVKSLDADYVIVNADLPYAEASLFDGDHQLPQYDWNDSYAFSSGVVAFHWSIDRTLDDLNTHNVFLTASTRRKSIESWAVVRGEGGNDPYSSHFNFYVHRASKSDATAAPKGRDSLLVLVPCPTLVRNTANARKSRKESLENYGTQMNNTTIDRIREAVFLRMGVIDSCGNLRDSILHEVVDTPATYAEQFNVGAGTPFALSHGLAQLSVTRPGACSSPFPNVLYCGASSRPGNGVPLVLTGAKLVAEKLVLRIDRAR